LLGVQDVYEYYFRPLSQRPSNPDINELQLQLNHLLISLICIFGRATKLPKRVKMIRGLARRPRDFINLKNQKNQVSRGYRTYYLCWIEVK